MCIRNSSSPVEGVWGLSFIHLVARAHSVQQGTQEMPAE